MATKNRSDIKPVKSADLKLIDANKKGTPKAYAEFSTG